MFSIDSFEREPNKFTYPEILGCNIRGGYPSRVCNIDLK